MKRFLLLLASAAVAAPVGAAPVASDATATSQAGAAATPVPLLAAAGEAQPLIQEARVVRRTVVGPRGNVRTFTYRGRPLAVVRRPAFVYPPGYSYRRWVAGAIVPAALIAAPFLFLEWQAAGLTPPPPSYRWVRHGPDLLLVDERTGMVKEVAYGAVQEE